jgi:SAM-dependent methyltransferase
VNLHYGCGLAVAEGWYNCDASPTLRLQRLPILGTVARHLLKPVFPSGVEYGNIAAGLKIEENSCAAIYCCHVLEHLSLEDARSALRNTYRYLRPGGLFRLVVPDFEQQVAGYIANKDPNALPNFLTYTHLGRTTRAKQPVALIREFFGNSYHLWMWDYKSLAKELSGAGFREIRRCYFGDSRNPAFLSVEHQGRFEWALAIECTK